MTNRESPFSFRDLTHDEARELERKRSERRIANADYTGRNEPPFTPSEARWHARQFIASNGPGNLVAMLGKAFVALQDAAAASESDWGSLYEQLQGLYQDECERTTNLRAILRDLGDEFDKLGESRLAKYARARAADV